jgi:Methyltransferase domain
MKAEQPHEARLCRIVGRIAQKKKRSRWYVLTLEVMEALDTMEEDDHFEDDDDAKDAVVLPTTQVVYIFKCSASSSSYHEFALYIHSIIAVTGHLVNRLPSGEKDDNAHRPTQCFFLVEHWQWMQCPPHLRVIANVLQILRRDAASSDLVAVLLPFAAPEYQRNQLQQRLLAAANANNKASISQEELQHWILRGLSSGGHPARPYPRQRRPRVSRADRELLQCLSDPMEPRFVPLTTMPTDGFQPRSFAQPQSARGPETRQQYMQYKKEPQVQWLMQRVEQLLSSSRRSDVRILDIGGGRGDLAVQLARRWAHITVVDRNSLTACQDWAVQQDVPLTLRQVDFFAFMEKSDQEHWDCVVAWHACGDLTDAALFYAQHHASAWIICPCCYNKTSRPDHFIPPYYSTLEQELQCVPEQLPRIQRLAETSQDAATSRRAALWINGRRLAAVAPGWRVHLEEFSSDYSARNLVLVGTKDSSGV